MSKAEIELCENILRSFQIFVNTLKSDKQRREMEKTQHKKIRKFRKSKSKKSTDSHFHQCTDRHTCRTKCISDAQLFKLSQPPMEKYLRRPRGKDDSTSWNESDKSDESDESDESDSTTFLANKPVAEFLKGFVDAVSKPQNNIKDQCVCYLKNQMRMQNLKKKNRERKESEVPLFKDRIYTKNVLPDVGMFDKSGELNPLYKVPANNDAITDYVDNDDFETT